MYKLLPSIVCYCHFYSCLCHVSGIALCLFFQTKVVGFVFRGHSRSFKLVTFESLVAVSYWPSIVTIALSCISSEIKPDIGRKLYFFSYPPLHSTPLLGAFPSEYRHSVWYEKTGMVSLLDGEKISKICLFVLA